MFYVFKITYNTFIESRETFTRHNKTIKKDMWDILLYERGL